MENGIQSRSQVNASLRFLVAYTTTFVVIASYLWLSFKTRVFGREYRERRIGRVHRRNARRVAETILGLQGLFIKVGQLFSIMTNFLPEEFRQGLENLQDAVPARPYEQIERRIREEFGRPPEDIFKSFGRDPIASASLGQVHAAEAKDGRKLAVKVQHVGVEEMVRADLKTIRRILRIVQCFVPVRGLENYYHEIRAMILDEIDFRKEAEHIAAIARNFAGNDRVGFPRVVEALSTSRVLTLEFVEGVKITDRQGLVDLGLDPGQVARDLVTAYCQMIFVDGLYHADPHPGNILVQAGGRLVFLDFGAVGSLSPAMRQGISSFMEAIIKQDAEKLVRSLRSMGFLQTGSVQSESATRVIEHFHRKFQEELSLDSLSLSSIKFDTRRGFEHLADLRQMDIGIREVSRAMHMPREWVLLERAVLLLTGLCTHLDPQMNPADIIRPYLEEFVLGKDRDWTEMLFNVTRDRLVSFLSLPSEFQKLIGKTIAGKISFQVEGLTSGSRLIYAAAHQIVFTLGACTAAGVAMYLHHAGEVDLARYAAYAGCGFAALVLLSMIRARRHRNR